MRVVPDTNVVISAQMSIRAGSPNQELFDRWQRAEFILLYSEDTLFEYVEKLNELGVAESIVRKFVAAIVATGIEIEIEYFHLRYYPSDPDDIAFLLCAVNGNATHLVSHDRHLLRLDDYYLFRICKTIDFLVDLRKLIGE